MSDAEVVPAEIACNRTIFGEYCALGGLSKAFAANKIHDQMYSDRATEEFNKLVELAGSFIGREGCAQFSSTITTSPTT